MQRMLESLNPSNKLAVSGISETNGSGRTGVTGDNGSSSKEGARIKSTPIPKIIPKDSNSNKPEKNSTANEGTSSGTTSSTNQQKFGHTRTSSLNNNEETEVEAVSSNDDKKTKNSRMPSKWRRSLQAVHIFDRKTQTVQPGGKLPPTEDSKSRRERLIKKMKKGDNEGEEDDDLERKKKG